MNANERRRWLVIGAIVMAAALLGDKLLFTPLTRLWKQRAEQIVRLQRQVGDGERMLERGPALRSRWDQMRTNTLPGNTSVAEQEILRAFDFWSQSSHASILSLTPQWKRDTDELMTLECRVDAAGTLSTVTRFLYDIEKDPLALKLENVEITARDGAGKQLSLGLHISGLVLDPPKP